MCHVWLLAKVASSHKETALILLSYSWLIVPLRSLLLFEFHSFIVVLAEEAGKALYQTLFRSHMWNLPPSSFVVRRPVYHRELLRKKHAQHI